MTTDQTNRVCEQDSYAIKIPEKLLNEKTLAAIQKSVATYFESKKLQHAFSVMYPYLRDGSEWVIPMLFKEVKGDPECSEIIKSPQTLRYYMNQFAQTDMLLTSNGDGKTTYRFNQEIWWNVLGSTQFKEEVEYQYHHIYIIVCIITRILKDLFPLTNVNSIYDLTSTLVGICTQLAIADLRERGIPERACNGCAYPLSLSQESQDPMVQVPVETTIPEPAKSSPSPTKTDEVQETVTKPAEELPPPEIGAKSPTQSTPLETRQVDAEKEIPIKKSSTTAPTIQSQPTDPPLPSNTVLKRQTYLYIEDHDETGISHNDIIAYFEERGASRAAIEDVLKEGINAGTFYQPEKQKYRILGSPNGG